MSESADSIGKVICDLESLVGQHVTTIEEGIIRTCDRLSALERQSAERIAELERDNENLCAVMIAAAEEIHEHWDAHCDEEGYGPANLMRRLEQGFPAEYGYKAGDFKRLQARAERAEAALAEACVLLRAILPALACQDTYSPCSDLRRCANNFLAKHNNGGGGNG